MYFVGINTALQIVNALRFKGNVAPFAVETHASAFSFLLFFFLLLRFKSSASTARQLSVCARNLSNAALGPMCRRSVQTVAWDERTPGLRVKPVEGFIELCNCGGRRLPQNQEQQEARHLQTEAWTLQWHACPWRMLTDAALTLESQEERCWFGCLQPKGC